MSQMADNQNRTVEEHVRLIREGVLTSEQWVKSCLEKIDATDPAIGAWAHLDSGLAMEQARQMDQIRRAGKPTGLLHGAPVGVKDIFDTDDQPTGRGSAIYAGRQPDANSAVVEKLKEAGAVILGKTVSTELAYMHPADTRNPHNTGHSPGGLFEWFGCCCSCRTCPAGDRQPDQWLDHSPRILLWNLWIQANPWSNFPSRFVTDFGNA